MSRYLINFFLFLLPTTRFFSLRSAALRLVGIKIGNNVSFCGHGFIYGRGSVSIGDRTWLSPGVIIRTHPDATVTIGCNCDIGPNVTFITGSHVIGGADRRAGCGFALPIAIGDGCWIGASTLLLPGVVLGSGCVVAAGSVVTKSFSSNLLLAGVPARVVKSLST